MKVSPLPENEKERLEAIRAYQILDTEEEQDYDDIVELAAQLCHTPIAIITLIDQNRQWFKAKTGLDIKETPRDLSFCAHAIHLDDILVVPDTLQDERFFDNPQVTDEPYIRFYAGMPLITREGYKLGTVAVIDQKPRTLSERQGKHLRMLAKQVVNLLELRYSLARQKEINKEIAKRVEAQTAEIVDIFDRVSDAFVAVDQSWYVTYINERAAQITSRSPGEVIGKNLWAEFPEAFSSDFPSLAKAAMASQQHQYQEAYFAPYNRWFETHIYPSPTGLSIYFRDITERKNTELIVQQSEKWKQLIVNSALDAIICIDVQGLITAWNPQAEKIFGWKEKEILGSRLTDTIIPAQYREQHKKGMHHYLKTGKGPILNKIIEITALNRQQEEFPVELTISSIKQNENEFFCAFIRDISERKRAEESLRQAEKRYRDIFENAIEGIYQTTPEGKFITLNPSLAKMFGYETPDDMIRSVTNIATQIYADPQDRERIIRLLETQGHAIGIEVKLLKKNKEIMWARFNNRVVRDDEGSIRYYEGTLKDITERKEAEEKLRDSENKLRAFFKSTPDASVLLGKHFEILAYNNAANQLVENTYGRQMKEGEIYTDLIFPEMRPLIVKYLERAFSGETIEQEFAIPNRKTGRSEWWLAVFMPVFDTEGNIFGVISNATNINAVKRAELKLKKQYEELQKTNHELDRFVYSVSHDLRAPLASILGLINVAELDEPSVAQKNYLGMIRDSINRLDGFIRDILDYSRNSRVEVKSERVDFNVIIAQVQDKLKLISGADRLIINLEIDDQVDFYSDCARIEIIFSNLFSNAIKYQDFHKEKSYVTVQIVTSNEKARIRFSDNGIGIEEHHLDHIFNMFYRASENATGSGIGLYIAREAVSRVKGTIRVQSVFGAYTTFEIEIPNAGRTEPS
jgi:PAS domain S-box-containing protein